MTSQSHDARGLLVVIPCLNEAEHLPDLLAWLSGDQVPQRIVVVDGGSHDGSQGIVRDAAQRDPRIVLVDNPRRLQSAAVNLALRLFGADAEMFVRVDAHAAYPEDYLARLIAAQQESGADSVTVAMRATAVPRACFQAATACAQNSVLGAGGSPHRKAGARRWVDHGHHALFKTAAFLGAGGYDESFTHNEDAEFDARLAARGGKILLAADIVLDYFPRTTARALARQYFSYGRGRARNTRKHKLRLKPRQLAPAAVAPIIALGIAGAPFTTWALAPMAAWLALSLGYGAVLGVRERSVCASGAGAAAAVMHAAWSVGFLTEHLIGPRASPGPAALAAPH